MRIYGLPKYIKVSVFERDGWKCLNCHSRKKLTVDHILPKSLGGSDKKNNLQTLCKCCNEKKGNKSTKDYRNSNSLPVMDMNMACKVNNGLTI